MIEWDETFSVENSDIDEQHQKLIWILNDFQAKVVENPERELVILPETLDHLFDYVQYHFDLEEKLLEDIHYSHIESHIAQHLEIRDHLQSMKIRLANNQTVITLEMVVFLQDWLVEHILGTDMKYKGLLK